MRPNKPAYSVPTMTEIAAIPLNGYKAVSTFSGCGGSSLGYRMAGFKMLWANEFVPEAQAVYRANFPDTLLDTRDIRKVKAEDILAATGLQRGELDLLDGSPPCSSFSTAGKRSKGWGKAHAYSTGRVQRTDDLFFEFVRLLDGLRPRVFVAENVSGLVKGVGKGYFLEILAALRGCGYHVRSRLLDAQWLGVPQARQRLIFIGTRDDLGVDPAFPAPLAYRYSVRDALPSIGSVGSNRDYKPTWRSADGPAPTIGTAVFPNNGSGLVIGVECANGYNGHAMLPASGPAPTIQASRPVKVMTRNGARSAAKPAPTVQTHGNRHTRSELTLAVEPEAGRVIVRQGNGNGHSSSRGKRLNLADPAPTVVARGTRYSGGTDQFIVEPDSDMRRFAVGRELDKLGQGEQSARYFQLTRAALAEPSGTITAAGGNASTAAVAHPTECRKFSIAELRCICAFPDDFVLTGTYAQQWERLGRAVPPVMMRARDRRDRPRPRAGPSTRKGRGLLRALGTCRVSAGSGGAVASPSVLALHLLDGERRDLDRPADRSARARPAERLADFRLADAALASDHRQDRRLRAGRRLGVAVRDVDRRRLRGLGGALRGRLAGLLRLDRRRGLLRRQLGDRLLDRRVPARLRGVALRVVAFHGFRAERREVGENRRHRVGDRHFDRREQLRQALPAVRAVDEPLHRLVAVEIVDGEQLGGGQSVENVCHVTGSYADVARFAERNAYLVCERNECQGNRSTQQGFS